MAANAQQLSNHSTFKVQMDPHLRQILSKQQGNPASKTTGVKQRVIEGVYSAADTNGVLVVEDSTVLTYNGNAWSLFDYNNITDYDLSQASLDVKYSKAIFSQREYAPTVNPYIQYTRTFNSQGLPDSSIYGEFDPLNALNLYYRTTLGYNGNGKLINETRFHDSSGTYVLEQKKKWVYSTNGQLVTDSIINFRPQCVGCLVTIRMAGNHVYDALGNEAATYSFRSINGSSWDTTDVYNYSYYSNNLLKTQLTRSLGLTGAHTISVDSFGYNVGNTLYSYWGHFTVDTLTTAYTSLYRYYRQFDNNGIPYQLFTTGYNNSTATLDTFFCHYHLTTFGNPDTIRTTTNSNGPVMAMTVFRYETFNDLAVQEKNMDRTLTLFPNPANNAITIRRDYNFTNKETAIIWNAAGQKLIEQGLGSDKSTNITINQITPGIYWLLVQDEKGAVICRQSFVKK